MSHAMSNPVVTIATPEGEIVIEVDVASAPRAATYFLALVEAGAMTDVFIYRSTRLGDPDRGPLIQAGPLGPRFTDAATGSIPTGLTFPPEFDTTDRTGLRHVRGTVSFARDLLDTGAVIPEIFLCLDDYPELDAGGRTEPDERGFPAFGSVRAGLAAGATTGVALVSHLAGEILDPPVRMSASRTA
ncbi:MAG: peptidylprolyl isomerase [Acidimicrobiales bacterium]|nr:peptidylprolyl isomerase [Acidimicrobiales bacterium]